jgi:hypothetical protein
VSRHDIKELVVMFTTSAQLAEIEYRQQRFLDEARAHRLAKLARAAASSRKPRRLGALIQLRSAQPEAKAAAADRGADRGGSSARAA